MYLLCWVHANTTTRIFDIQAGDSLRDAIGYPCTVYTKYRNVIICRTAFFRCMGIVLIVTFSLSGKVHSGQVVGGSTCHFILLIDIDLVAWVVSICVQNF